MLKHTNLNRVMKISDHFKNKAQLNGLINKVGVVFIMLLFPLYLTAQITFAEKQPVDNTPEWWHLKDEIFKPYDSTYLKLERYPTLKAYKKYIGQTLFYIGDRNILFLSKNAIEIKDETYLSEYYAIKEKEREEKLINKYGYSKAVKILNGKKNKKGEIEYGVEYEVIEKPKNYIYNNIFTLKNKYFDIIDVISDTDIEYKKRFDISKPNDIWGSRTYKQFAIKPYEYDEDDKYGRYGIAFPIFVLRETVTGDTLYSTCYSYGGGYRNGNYVYEEKLSTPLILVGGFMKLKKEFVGQTILKINYVPSISSSIPKIEKKWTCIDVSVSDLNTRENKASYNDGVKQKVTLVLQSENDSPKKYLAYNNIESTDYEDNFFKVSYDSYYITEKQFLKNKQEKEITEQEKQREEEQKLAEERQKREKKINERKNKLTAEFGTGIAEKIIAGNFVVGMSKKACKETMQSLTNQIVALGVPNAYMSRVVSSTATTEVWETYRASLFGERTDGPFMYLYFDGDKLVKINDIKSLF